MKFDISLDDKKMGITEEVRKVIDEQRGGNKGLFETQLTSLVSRKFKEGLPNKKSRCMNRILNKLDVSVDGILDLDPTEYEFLVSVFMDDDVTVLPHEVRLVGIYQEKIEQV